MLLKVFFYEKALCFRTQLFFFQKRTPKKAKNSEIEHLF